MRKKYEIIKITVKCIEVVKHSFLVKQHRIRKTNFVYCLSDVDISIGSLDMSVFVGVPIEDRILINGHGARFLGSRVEFRWYEGGKGIMELNGKL